MGRGPLCCTFFFVSCFILLCVCVTSHTSPQLPCELQTSLFQVWICRPTRGAKGPGQEGKRHPWKHWERWAQWGKAAPLMSHLRVYNFGFSIGVTGSADKLKCSFPLCPENHGANSQPLCSLLWILFMDPLSFRAGCSWTSTCVDTITLALPLHPGSEGCVASTPS